VPASLDGGALISARPEGRVTSADERIVNNSRLARRCYEQHGPTPASYEWMLDVGTAYQVLHYFGAPTMRQATSQGAFPEAPITWAATDSFTDDAGAVCRSGTSSK